MKKALAWLAALLLCACASVQRPASVERLYVIECGENHVTDLSRWTTLPSDAGKPAVFSDNCYLIKHAQAWMLWDTGYSDRLASLPNGQSAANGLIVAYRKTRLVDSLKEIGLAPADIRYVALSHTHPDHAGNADLFTRSTIYLQRAEPANSDALRGANVVKLDGDYDVFGDGSVVIKSTPGHTPGHQSLFVRLPKTGPVLLSGDMVHFRSNWDAKRVPLFNYDRAASLRSMNEMAAFIERTGAKLWINHDFAQSATLPKLPQYIE